MPVGSPALRKMNTKARLVPAVRFGLAAALFLPVGLSAQVLPGQPRPQDRWEVQQMQLRARMLERVNVVLSAWQEAWNTDDTEAISETYSQVGTLLVSGEVLKGRDQIEAHFQGILPSLGHLTFSLVEFESGGSMTMMLSNYLFREEVAPNERREVLGHCLTVFVEEHGSWKIRSQVFQPATSS